MKRISYIAMLATAAFCQLSSCMNQAPNSGDRNQSSPAARTLDMWSLKLPNDFSVKSVPAKNRVVEVDFDNNEVRISATMHINISFDGSEVKGSTSLSFVRTRLPSAIQVPGGNQRASSAPSANMRPLQTHTFTIPVGAPHAFPAPFIAMRQPQLPPFMIPGGNPHASSARSVDTHPHLEMKEENKQERIDSQKKTGSDSELFGTPKKKEEESKRPKTPENLKKIENSNSDTEELDKKEAKQTVEISCKSFLKKYAKKALDDDTKKLIKDLFDKGTTDATDILDALLTPPAAAKKWKSYKKVWGKVYKFLRTLKG